MLTELRFIHDSQDIRHNKYSMVFTFFEDNPQPALESSQRQVEYLMALGTVLICWSICHVFVVWINCKENLVCIQEVGDFLKESLEIPLFLSTLKAIEKGKWEAGRLKGVPIQPDG